MCEVEKAQLNKVTDKTETLHLYSESQNVVQYFL